MVWEEFEKDISKKRFKKVTKKIEEAIKKLLEKIVEILFEKEKKKRFQKPNLKELQKKLYLHTYYFYQYQYLIEDLQKLKTTKEEKEYRILLLKIEKQYKSLEKKLKDYIKIQDQVKEKGLETIYRGKEKTLESHCDRMLSEINIVHHSRDNIGLMLQKISFYYPYYNEEISYYVQAHNDHIILLKNGYITTLDEIEIILMTDNLIKDFSRDYEKYKEIERIKAYRDYKQFCDQYKKWEKKYINILKQVYEYYDIYLEESDLYSMIKKVEKEVNQKIPIFDKTDTMKTYDKYEVLKKMQEQDELLKNYKNW